MKRALARLAAVAIAVAVAACSGPIAANSPVARPTPPPTPTLAPSLPDPQPIHFPADDGPHRRLTEWWYYTGHLVDDAGHHYGFEFVVFRAERAPLPVTWASHLALTDETGKRFYYAQRSEIGPQVDSSPRDAAGLPTGFALSVTALLPTQRANRPAWRMSGSGGIDTLTASLAPDEARHAGIGGLALDLRTEPHKPPVLHQGTGWIDFGEAGGSYYYSRTALATSGTLTIDGKAAHVTGTSWFDHQWGDFIAVGAGGWDWFAVELADGTDLMLSLVRAADGSYPLRYGSLVAANGTVHHLTSADFTVGVDAHWTSPRTGAAYPAGWTISIPAEKLRIGLTPTVADQELDARATAGVTYWEGSQVVEATRDGKPVAGQAYVELTGYPPAR